MLEMKLNGGSFTIDDNNNNIVDESVKKELEKGFKDNADNEGKELKNITEVRG